MVNSFHKVKICLTLKFDRIAHLMYYLRFTRFFVPSKMLCEQLENNCKHINSTQKYGWYVCLIFFCFQHDCSLFCKINYRTKEWMYYNLNVDRQKLLIVFIIEKRVLIPGRPIIVVSLNKIFKKQENILSMFKVFFEDNNKVSLS